MYSCEELFSYWKTSLKGDHFYIQSEKTGDSVLVYTKKSFKREAALLNKRLSECSLNKQIFLWIAPFHEEIFSLLDPKWLKNFIWICISDFSKKKKYDQIDHILFSKEQIENRFREISKDDSIKIDFHFTLKSSRKDNFLLLARNLLTNLIKQSAVRLKTIHHFQKIWEYNFKANLTHWQKSNSILNLKPFRPDTFILGSPNSDFFLENVSKQKNKKNIIWCADTAISACILHGVHPEITFSIDGGYASYEHFSHVADRVDKNKFKVVLDPLAFPRYYRIGLKVYTYTNSNPLIQSVPHRFPYLQNDTGDVYGIMKAMFHYFFKDEYFPQVFGREQKSIKHVTHLRGSGYHLRQYCKMDRTSSNENYFYHLSKKW